MKPNAVEMLILHHHHQINIVLNSVYVMWIYIKFIHCPYIPIGNSKNYYPIIMIVHSCNKLIFIFDMVVYQHILLFLVRWFEVKLILKPTMLHIEGHQSKLVIGIMNRFFRDQFIRSIQWCSELFLFMIFPAAFTTWFLQSIFMSFFDSIPDMPNALITRSSRFKSNICLSDLIRMLKE